MNKFKESSVDFAFALLNQVAKEGENALISPASISLALAMTYAGSDGNTKQQIGSIMFGGVPGDEVHDNLSHLVKVINAHNKEYQLDTANRIYCEKTYQVLQGFLDLVHKYYQSDCVSVDFTSQSEDARQQINKWVEEATKGKIKDLLSDPDAVSSDTRLFLVNAVYFKGEWLKAFDPKGTSKQPFQISEDRSIEVDMMYAKHKEFKCNGDDRCLILGVPYKGGDCNLTMYFLLPRERFGLSKLLSDLKGSEFIELMSIADTMEVEAHIPKFKLEQGFDLASAFEKLGMSDMFDGGSADFSAISGAKDLYVSGIYHKTFIEVNEQGTEAAGATGVGMMMRCLPMQFVADQPFLFAIVEESTKSLLFLGQFYG